LRPDKAAHVTEARSNGKGQNPPLPGRQRGRSDGRLASPTSGNTPHAAYRSTCKCRACDRSFLPVVRRARCHCHFATCMRCLRPVAANLRIWAALAIHRKNRYGPRSGFARRNTTAVRAPTQLGPQSIVAPQSASDP
jgi:hypothetical protein